ATGIVWDQALCEYDFGPYHPMAPIRLALTHELARGAGLLERPGVQLLDAPVASEAQLAQVHDPQYIEAVQRASTTREALSARELDALLPFGIGGDDVPPFPGMHTAAARIAGGSLTAVDAILSGRVRRAVNFAGGLHHAKPASASGFCVYNDAALAIRHALDAGEERVMYVDVDVHHGDGVERALWDEPRAVTLSVHETCERLFPGPGLVHDRGGPGAAGTAITVPPPRRPAADAWLHPIRARDRRAALPRHRLRAGPRRARRRRDRDQRAAAAPHHRGRLGARDPRHGPGSRARGAAHAPGHPARRRHAPPGSARRSLR